MTQRLHRTLAGGNRIAALAVCCVVGLWSTDVAGAEWQEIASGVEYLEKTKSGPVDVHAVRVDLCEPGVRIRATGEDEVQKRTSEFGDNIGAIFAVNGGFFEPDYSPTGLAAGGDSIWSTSSGRHGFVAFGKHRAEIVAPGDGAEAQTDWISDAVDGSTKVLTDGKPMDEDPGFCGTRHPRTAVGLSEDGARLLLVVADGRRDESIGLRCTELGGLMKSLGADEALNLDGGGSTTMWRKGEGVVNQPSAGMERVVANHLAVETDDDATGAMSCPDTSTKPEGEEPDDGDEEKD